MGKYSYLNLSQKMIRIRKKIPMLIKKRYSEEVDYEFVKIDDIYGLLTPALNRYGVDFEIVEESCTRRDASGNPVFLTENDGLWKYEANLKLCWINADSPDDRNFMTIHVIGTHEIPEKAKGTAWTYGLKYYLLNRFSIKQGGFDDPDMMNIHPPKNQEPEGGSFGHKPGKEASAAKAAKEKTGSAARVGKEKAGSTGETGKNGKIHQGEGCGTESIKATAGRNGNMEVKADTSESARAEKEKAQVPGKDLAGRKEADEGVQVNMDFGDADTPTEKKDSLAPAAEAGEDHAAWHAEYGNLPDGFFSASSEKSVPFGTEEEGGFMQDLRQEIADAEDESEIEKARKCQCDFGLYEGQTLGEMMDSPKGKEIVKWIARRYKGGTGDIQKAAKLLIESEKAGERAA